MARTLKVYQMIPPGDCTAQIGSMIVMLNLTQYRIIKYVSNLSMHELDYTINKKTPTIGTLLKHIIAMEYITQLRTFEHRGFNVKEAALWEGVLPGPGQMLDRMIKGNPASYYNKLWRKTRAKTIKGLKQKMDNWLYDMVGEYNNYFMWYHLLEDHLCHFGQIKAIIKRIPNVQSKR